MQRLPDRIYEATLEVAKGPFNRAFTTRNTPHGHERVDMELVQGPFRTLEGTWRFEPRPGGGTVVSLDLDFEFSSRVLGLALGPVFRELSGDLMESFTRRADALYGASA